MTGRVVQRDFKLNGVISDNPAATDNKKIVPCAVFLKRNDITLGAENGHRELFGPIAHSVLDGISFRAGG